MAQDGAACSDAVFACLLDRSLHEVFRADLGHLGLDIIPTGCLRRSQGHPGWHLGSDGHVELYFFGGATGERDGVQVTITDLRGKELARCAARQLLKLGAVPMSNPPAFVVLKSEMRLPIVE